MTLGLAYKSPADTGPVQVSRGTPFQSEYKLVSAFEGMLQDTPEYDGWKVLREFESVDGVADVVFFELNQATDRARRLGGIPPRWAYALRSLPYRKKFSVHDFAAWTGVTVRHAGQMLERYHVHGFCEPDVVGNTWVKIQRPQLLSTRIHAVEAKLRDWRRALRQAYRYLDYACQSWVLLDASSVGPAIAHLNEFARLNIGLASLSTESKIMIHFVPRSSVPRSGMRFWQANAEIARRLQSGL